MYTQMMKVYASDQDYMQDDLDDILRGAHRLLHQETSEVEPRLAYLLGRAGAKMLRGARLRPLWLQVSHPRIQVALSGLQTLMDNLRVTPYFNYPLEDLAVERQKRKKIKGNVVAELGVFRNFRQGGSGYTDMNIALERDEYDTFLDSFFTGFEFLDVEPDQTAVDLITMSLEVRLVHEGVDGRFLLRLLVYCNRWKLSQVSDVILELLAELEWDDPLFFECWSFLKSFESKALPAMRRFARAHRDSPLLPYLAVFLASGPQASAGGVCSRRFSSIILRRTKKRPIWPSPLPVMGRRRSGLLEQVLASAKQGNGPYRKALKKALATAQEASN